MLVCFNSCFSFNSQFWVVRDWLTQIQWCSAGGVSIFLRPLLGRIPYYIAINIIPIGVLVSIQSWKSYSEVPTIGNMSFPWILSIKSLKTPLTSKETNKTEKLSQCKLSIAHWLPICVGFTVHGVYGIPVYQYTQTGNHHLPHEQLPWSFFQK